jgi:hypothetical protein
MPKGTYRNNEDIRAVPSPSELSYYDAIMVRDAPTDSNLQRLGMGGAKAVGRPNAPVNISLDDTPGQEQGTAIWRAANKGDAARINELQAAMRGTDVTMDDVYNFMSMFGPDDDVHNMTADEVVKGALSTKVQMMMDNDGFNGRNR